MPNALLQQLKEALLKFSDWITLREKDVENVFPSPKYDKDPQDLPMNKENPETLIQKFCEAIRDYEGKPGDRSYRNNNPGNCRFSSVGYLPLYEPVLKDKDGFAIFKDWETGFLYLKNLVRHTATQHPTWTFYYFFANKYAPKSDGNDPVKYTAYVAKVCGVPVDTPLSNLIN